MPGPRVRKSLSSSILRTSDCLAYGGLRGGGCSCSCLRDGRHPATGRSAVAEMERALGIDLGVAGRLSMMLGGGHFAARDTLNL